MERPIKGRVYYDSELNVIVVIVGVFPDTIYYETIHGDSGRMTHSWFDSFCYSLDDLRRIVKTHESGAK